MNSFLAIKRRSIAIGMSFLVILILLCLNSNPAFGQDENEEPYRIGTKDVLSISFWQEPDLNTSARVAEDGMITLPVIGEIKAAGLTTRELSQSIVEQMTFYHTPISQATVTVTEFNSRNVVVTGEVLRPSALSYEKIPDLWRVILDAGGPTDEADLSEVTVIRKNEKGSEVINIDLYDLIKKGDLSKVPEVQAGDMINVPASPFGTALQLGESVGIRGRNIYYILGSVRQPGVRSLDAGIDVLDAIAIAGGFTDDADLENVRVIMKGPRYSNVVRLNLKEYMNSGAPPRMELHPEDTIVVPAKKASLFGGVLGTVAQVVPLLTAVGTLILLTQ
jgi:polysaccharide export outer membrane protein